jgi:hypothetical protein
MAKIVNLKQQDGRLFFNNKISGAPCKHQFFVGLHDPNGDRTVFPANDRGITLIQALLQGNAEIFLCAPSTCNFFLPQFHEVQTGPLSGLREAETSNDYI